MKKPLAVGDRVRVLGTQKRGVISLVSGNACVVKFSATKNNTFHRELLIRLIPKPKRVARELYMEKLKNGDGYSNISDLWKTIAIGERVDFLEKLPKKERK